ncbi:MAG: hypothetical protein V1493_04680 [Candidatus Diapherotrites archaeon]
MALTRPVRRKPGSALAVFSVDGKKINEHLMRELAQSGWAGRRVGGDGHFLVPQKVPLDRRFRALRGRKRSLILRSGSRDFAIKGIGSSQAVTVISNGEESLSFPFGWIDRELASRIRKRSQPVRIPDTLFALGHISVRTNGQLLRGGMIVGDARKNYSVAKRLNALFEESLAGNTPDRVIKRAVELGATFPPTLEPVAVMRPEQAVFKYVRGKEPGSVFEEILEHLTAGEARAFKYEFKRKKPGDTIVFKSKKLMELSGIPENILKKQAVFIYSVPLELRMSDLHPLCNIDRLSAGKRNFAVSAWKKLFSAYGIDSTFSGGRLILRRGGRAIRPEEALVQAMKAFSANMCGSIHLMHKLGGCFTIESSVGGFGGSLVTNNITADGRPLDLDTATFSRNAQKNKTLQEADIYSAQRLILEFAAKLAMGKTVSEAKENAMSIAKVGYSVMKELLGVEPVL